MQDATVRIVTQFDGQKLVRRSYPYDVPAYRELKGHKCINLPEICSAEMQNGLFVVEEEFIDGISLQEMLDAGECFTEETVCRIGIEICKALSFMHESGFIHRDIKPEHVLVTLEGRTVLIDLDASMRIIPGKKNDTQLLGTLGYAAPEQFGLTRSDHRTDIYELGILLNELLTGMHPVMNRYKKGKVGIIIERCTRINLDERYMSIKELLKALQDVLNDKLDENIILTTDESVKAQSNIKLCEGLHKRKIAALALSLLLFVAFTWMISYTKNDADEYGVLSENAAANVQTDELSDGRSEKEMISGAEQLYIGNEKLYYNSRLGSQSADLKTKNGVFIDKSYEVWADEAVGYIEGWDDYYEGWTLVSENCETGATGYLYAKKDGKTYAIQVIVTGEPMSAYAALPDFDNLATSYLKPAGRAVNSEKPNQIFVGYTPDKPLTLYLAAMHAFYDVVPMCSDANTQITLYEGDTKQSEPLYELTFSNPAGGYREVEVRSKHNNLVFCFTDITTGDI